MAIRTTMVLPCTEPGVGVGGKRVNSGSGSSSRPRPIPGPTPLPIPPPTPGSVHGKTIVVRLAIDATGKVHEVELIPSSGDRGFDQALRKTALGWHFRPARDAANAAVPVNYDVTFQF